MHFSGTAPIVVGFMDSIIGMPICSIGYTTVMGYLQKRNEENTVYAINSLKEHIEKIEAKLNEYEPNEIRILKDDIFPLIFDYSSDEVQKEKIKMIINGFEYIVDKKLLDQDKILELYDVLKNLRLKEINCFVKLQENSYDLEDHLDQISIKRLFDNYIISVPANYALIDGEPTNYSKKDIKVTNFGQRFYYFIKREYENKNEQNKSVLCTYRNG